METGQVQAGKDTLLAFADKAKAVDAVAELVWNSLDAEATTVGVTVTTGSLGGPEELGVQDNGHGITTEKAKEVFLIHGESWKKNQRFSDTIKRPLHGQMGRGRFLTFGIADRVEWKSVADSDSSKKSTTITGLRVQLNFFDFDGPYDSDDETGTLVTLRLRQEQKVARLVDDNFPLQLTSRLAPALLAYTDVTVTYRGAKLEARPYVLNEIELPLELDNETLRGHAAPKLVLIEWSENMNEDVKSRDLFLCDEHGAVVTEFRMGALPPAPIFWNAYLKWEGFRDPALMGQADLIVPDVQHAVMLRTAERAIAAHLNERLDQQRGRLIAEWKAQGVYPYHGEAATAAEELERDLFDVVAVVASPGIGKDAAQKKLSLRLLQEGVQTTPDRLPKILNAVFALSDDEQEVLSELLDRTQLTAVIRAARTISDRADFVRGLGRLLFSDETKREFREVDQLHPMLVEEPWIFGDEWTLTLSESGLTGVVKSCMKELDSEAEFAPQKVVLPSGKQGRVDMLFYRYLAESDRGRHLVVELKRPMKVTMKEYGQLANYATAITDHPQVSSSPNQWDFWLVCTEMDKTVQNQVNENGLVPGTTTKYRLWVVTWAQLLDSADRRLEAFRKELEIISTEETGRAYLQRVHAEYIPGEPSENVSVDLSDESIVDVSEVDQD